MSNNKLDEKVECELSRSIIVPGFNVAFTRSRVLGCGYFVITGSINEVAFEYSREATMIVLTLRKNDDSINIFCEGEMVKGVYVNDRYYHNPRFHVCGIQREEWQVLTEKEEDNIKVVELGKRKLKEVHAYLEAMAPSVVTIMNGYFSRSLVPLDDRVELRTAEEIFSVFDLNSKKD